MITNSRVFSINRFIVYFYIIFSTILSLVLVFLPLIPIYKFYFDVKLRKNILRNLGVDGIQHLKSVRLRLRVKKALNLVLYVSVFFISYIFLKIFALLLYIFCRIFIISVRGTKYYLGGNICERYIKYFSTYLIKYYSDLQDF